MWLLQKQLSEGLGKLFPRGHPCEILPFGTFCPPPPSSAQEIAEVPNLEPAESLGGTFAERSCHERVLSRHEFSHEKCSEFFSDIGPEKFLQNSCQISLPKIKKNHRRASEESTLRTAHPKSGLFVDVPLWWSMLTRSKKSVVVGAAPAIAVTAVDPLSRVLLMLHLSASPEKCTQTQMNTLISATDVPVWGDMLWAITELSSQMQKVGGSSPEIQPPLPNIPRFFLRMSKATLTLAVSFTRPGMVVWRTCHVSYFMMPSLKKIGLQVKDRLSASLAAPLLERK